MPQATEEATETPDPGIDTPETGPLTFIQPPRPDSGAIGISISEVTEGGDIILSNVTADSPAGKAGLKQGDIVLALNGNEISDRESLIEGIVNTKPPAELTFTVRRSGQRRDFKVAVSTRRQVYCPLSAPSGKPGNPIARDPLSTERNWQPLAGSTDSGAELAVADNVLSFEAVDSTVRWAGLATLKSTRVNEYILNVDITQTSRSATGLLLNYRASDGFYLLQILPNGGWTMTAIYNDGSTSGGLSFTEADLKTASNNNPSTSVTNKVTIQVEADNIYVSFNGKLVCGTPLKEFGDPPIGRGNIGVYALVDANAPGSPVVSFSNFSLVAINKSGAATASPDGGATAEPTAAATQAQ